MTKTNNRTLKKRIRFIINICVVFTIVVFSTLLIAMVAIFLKMESTFLCDYYSNNISQTMNSKYFLNQMSIYSLDDFDPTTTYSKQWFETIDKMGASPLDQVSQHLVDKASEASIDEDSIYEEPDIINVRNMINIYIELNGKSIYKQDADAGTFLGTSTDNSVHSAFTQKLFNYFDVSRESDLVNENNEVIGVVKVSVNNNFIVNIFTVLFFTIIIFSCIILVFNRIIISIITKPITLPLSALEKNINAVADGDFDLLMNSRVTVKKPLKEIESLADSTNRVIDKMKDFNETLTAQNEELEAQNEELFNSRNKIQEQQTMLVQTENMAYIGQLTAAITHEINTPLGAITSNAQLFDMFITMLSQNEVTASNEEVETLVNQMKETNDVSLLACTRVTEIIKSLKTFTKLDQAEFQEANIIDGIKSVLILTSNLWKKNITIHEDYGPLEVLRCYSGMLNQVIMNIVVNAIQSIENKGEIFIKTYNDENNMYISIRDTGAGISPENLSRVFENGFTTKKAGIGMGMGLAISTNIINRHNGEIRVVSELGKGSEFIVSIPLSL